MNQIATLHTAPSRRKPEADGGKRKPERSVLCCAHRAAATIPAITEGGDKALGSLKAGTRLFNGRALGLCKRRARELSDEEVEA